MKEWHLQLAGRDVTLVEGPAGWGEYSPLPGYPCDPVMARRAAIESALDGWPPAVRDSVPVNALVDGPGFDPVDLVGYPAVKVKVRTSDDLRLVAAVRDAVGPRVGLRIDANGSWDPETAVALIGEFARYDLEYVEQPVASLDDLARVRRRVAVAIAADECVRSVADAERLRTLDAADVLVVKVQPLGGVRGALAVAEAAGVPVVPTSMMETSVGIAAGLALAAALPELAYACGLATAALLGADVTRAPLVADHGRLQVRAVTPDPDLLERYTVSSQEVRS
jgi:o-succinylbenzoate synthase